MIELNFSNALLDIDNMLIFNKGYKEKDTIKIDSTSVLFNNLITEKNLIANYSLICFGEIKAEKIVIQNDLICYGDIACNCLEVYGELKCYGNLDVKEIYVGKNSIISGGIIEEGILEKNLIITSSLEVRKKLEVKENIICNESVFGDGSIKCDNITVNDFIEIKVDGKVNEVKLDAVEKSTEKNRGLLKEIEQTDNILEFINSKQYLESVQDLNSIITIIKRKIPQTEEMFDYEEISNILLGLCKLTPIFKIDYKIFKNLLHMSELRYIDDLNLFLTLVDYKRRIHPYILKISICDEMLNNFLVNEKNKLSDMKVDSIQNHSDFVKALSLAENNKSFFNENEYFRILDKIYSRIGIRSNMVRKLIE